MMGITAFRKVSTAAALAGFVLAAACGRPDGEPRRLPGSADSLDGLARSVVAGLAARDTARLQALRLTEFEHNELVWPKLPAARPEANFPVDFAWKNIQIRNRAALGRLLARYGGRPLELVGVKCDGETQRFDTFDVLTNCRVRFRDEFGTYDRQLFKDVLVMDGEYKIFRYYAD